MVTLETRKYNIITQITSLNNELAIQELENFIRNITMQLYYSNLIKPMRKDLVINDMIQEQQYNGVNRQYLDSIVQEMDIKEPINELIAMV